VLFDVVGLSQSVGKVCGKCLAHSDSGGVFSTLAGSGVALHSGLDILEIGF
jgi:hypothetical protein